MKFNLTNLYLLPTQREIQDGKVIFDKPSELSLETNWNEIKEIALDMGLDLKKVASELSEESNAK